MPPPSDPVFYRGLDFPPLRKLSSGDHRIREIVRFRFREELRLPEEFGEPEAHILARRLRAAGCLSLTPGESAEAVLIQAIRYRSASLAVRLGGAKRQLPGACPVVPARLAGATVFDPLSVLAAVTQSDDEVWLRDREPCLDRIPAVRRTISFARRRSSSRALCLGRRTVHEIALWVPSSIPAA